MFVMATVFLLHSAIGLRPGVVLLAEGLAARGHEIVLPDYYEGLVFADEAAGVAHRDEVGPRVLFDRVLHAADGAPPDAALMGLSLGAAFAQRLAGSRPEARGVVLLHHVTRPRSGWSGQPVQVHRYAEDPWIVPADVEALCRVVTDSGASFEDHVVPGKGHLFTDPDLPDHDAAATLAVVEHVDRLLRR